MSEFWKGLACAHPQTSPPDEMGRAICADCGGTIQVALTGHLMADFFDSLHRDLGHGRRHSKRCVRMPEQQWICADDCRIRPTL